MSLAIEATVKVLNDLLRNDPEAMRSLVNFRVRVGKKTAEHPTIEVEGEEPGDFSLGIIGLLNGCLRTKEGEFGPVVGVRDISNGKLLRFEISKE